MASVTPVPVPGQARGLEHLPTLWFGFALAFLLIVVEIGGATLHHNVTGTPLFLLLLSSRWWSWKSLRKSSLRSFFFVRWV